MFFFFQAEDGIRDYKVTGVQTCALPISRVDHLERIADLLLVVDASGAPLVQVPPMPRVEGLGIPRPTEAVARVAVVNDRAYLLGLAPLPAGMVVVGRRVESLDRLLAGLPSRPAVVVVAGDPAIGGKPPRVPPRGWLDPPRAGHAAGQRPPWLPRPPRRGGGGGLLGPCFH